METADIVVPAAHCEIVYEIPINRRPTIDSEPATRWGHSYAVGR